jgi:ABC-type Fe3+/spermidine/putrescine transport system ATPase subunit
LLTATRISKRFGRTIALDAVDFEARPGEIHVLLGENGAGKTTLMNIFAGRLRADSGAVTLDGRPLRPGSPQSALKMGIAAVHQSPMLFERFVKQILNLGPPDQAAIAKGVEAYGKEAAVLDGHLSKQKHLVGDSLTIADFAVAAPLFYAKQAELPLHPYPHIRGWFERVSALPCWRETAPQMPAAA